MAVSFEEKQKIIDALKKIMQQHVPPLVQKKVAKETGFELIGNVETPYGYKKEMVPGMYFSSIALQKDSVAFYFFPTYMNEAEFKKIAPLTYKHLKGKTCFHFKKSDDVNEKEIDALMKKGITHYKKQGWIK